jgi:protein-disulfide isomerase
MLRTPLAALLAAALVSALPASAQEPLPPGVDASALTPSQRDVLSKVLAGQYCHCGCPHTLGGCLKEHRACKHAPRMAELAVKLVGAGAKQEQVEAVLAKYYGGFRRKRATFNLKDAGPALGNPDAKITLVEFSDFTCPFCRVLRPRLEAWVKANASRVRLFYRPFFLPNHPRSMECAETGEFAREKGKFWPMHDLLFQGNAAPSDDELVSGAERLGLSGQELREALASKRFRPRIFASSAEGKAAGLEGTPTIFVNGRRFELTIGSARDPFESVEWGLDFTLRDEEEWVANGGAWAKD